MRYGRPEIFNTDQGCQFTGAEFSGELTKRQISISMDGRGRCLDNIFNERLWRSVKYKDVYLYNYQTIVQARSGLAVYFQRYNKERSHQALGYKTPWHVYTQESPGLVTKHDTVDNRTLVVKPQEAVLH